MTSFSLRLWVPEERLDRLIHPGMTEHRWKVKSGYTMASKFGQFPSPEVTSLKHQVVQELMDQMEPRIPYLGGSVD